MNIPARCRPLTTRAALTMPVLLIGLALSGCGYSPERSLTASSAAVSGKSQNSPKTQNTAKVKGGDGKPAAHAKAPDRKSRDVAAANTRTAPRRQMASAGGERECLVRAMYFESHRSSREGLLAVGTVVMNRLNSSSYPGTICSVVGQKNQFAPGVLTRAMTERERIHADAVADEVLAGKRHTGIGDAMFFHVASRRYKYPNMRYLQVAGGNIFYTKVGRNAPRVTSGPVLAYAGATARPAEAKAEDAPQIAAVDVSADTTVKATVSPQTTDAAAAITAAAPTPTLVSATKVSFTGPADDALMRARSFSAAPLKLAQYRLPH